MFLQFDVKEFFLERKLDIGFVLAGLASGFFLDWTLVESVLFSVFIWSIIGPIQARWLALPALFFFFSTPILLFFDQEKIAEEFAIYAYYFLVMLVIRGIIELRKEEESK